VSQAHAEDLSGGQMNSVPLSVSQEALWISWQLEPDQARYLIPYPLRVRGTLEIARLCRAVDELGRRHPVLRGRIVETPAGPELTWAHAPPILVVEQTVGEPLEAVVPQARRGLFDLHTGPLARVEVLRGSDQMVVLIWVHHIVFDGGSLPRLLADLRRAYNGESLGIPSDATMLAEFARRQRAIAQGPAGAECRDFWTDYLRDTPRIMELPAGIDAGQPSILPFDLDRDLTRKVGERASEIGATRFGFFFAAFLILLRRYVDQDELVVAIPFHGRVDRSLRNVVGFFSNTLPCRQKIASSDAYIDVIHAVHGNVRTMVAHGELPMTIIRSEIMRSRAGGKANDLPVLFQYWDADLRTDLDVRAVELEGDEGSCVLETLTIADLAEYAFTVMVRNDSAGTTTVWKDPGGAIGPNLISSMNGEYAALLNDMIENPRNEVGGPGTLIPETGAVPAGVSGSGIGVPEGDVDEDEGQLWLPRLRPHSPDDRQLDSVDIAGLPAEALHRFAMTECTGAAEVLIAALAVLLSWYTGQDSIGIGIARAPLTGGGTPSAGVSLRITAGTRFRDLLHSAEAALRNPPIRTAGYDVVFEYAETRDDATEQQDAPGDCDLFLRLQLSGERLLARLFFGAQCLDRWQIRAMGAHFVVLLERVMANPAADVSELEPLSADERRDHVFGWNDTETGYPHVALPTLLREQARTRAEATALVRGRERRTYRQLIARTEEIARSLVVRGVRQGELVALLMPRGIGQIEAMFGVLFAGAAYLPIDPSTPKDRLSFVLEDAGVRWIIAAEPGDNSRLAGLPVQVLDDRDLVADGGDLPLIVPEQPAYCIYTSGSTGRPKGVMVTHENVVRLIHNDSMPFALGPDDVWTMFHPYSFDVSVWEVFGCLSHGGRLVLVDETEARDSQRFWRKLQEERVTVLCQTPSAFAQLRRIAEAEPAPVDHLRYVLLAGEALHPRSVGRWMDEHSHVRIVNMYGPTETTVYATYRFIGPADVAANCSNIGVPLPTTTLYVVDPRLSSRLVPAGVTGELLIGGLGVANGYLNRPELTAERFPPNPFGGGAVFRSGDMVRRLADGSVEFLGRKDSQIKLRGYRIELGEIESCLRENVRVADAVVQPDGVDKDRLMAFVLPAIQDRPPSAADLRGQLRRMLPDYMIPAAFSVVDELPLTRNGKLDRAALADLAVLLPEADGLLPETATARSLAQIWAGMLNRPDIYADSSFLDMGGHSLQVGRLVSQVEERFDVRLQLRTVFDHPRLQELADLIDERLGGSDQATGSPTPAPKQMIADSGQ